MIERFDLVVFDWDGTLMDSTAAIVRSIQSAAADLALPVPTTERARHVIGLGLQEALAYAVPELSLSQAGEFAARYRHHYLQQENQLDLYSGALELLSALGSAQVRLAVATGKSTEGLARALRATGLRDHFAALRCADQTHPKPHPAMLQELMHELGSTPQRTLMVGDTTHDLAMAIAAGTSAVALTHGAHGVDQLRALAPAALLNSLPELQQWLMPH